jgi:hypothetical protein
MSMKTLLVFVAVCVVIVAPAFAQPRSKAGKHYASRVHPYAGKYYAPRYPRYGNRNKPDFPFCVSVPAFKC